ncbi:hypothetical protein [Deinococcus sp. SL84]|uniref:hypothetical protein n=1 Tax=Deinococcus sp. SL84 TaxID=2994663 RepID=UPI0022769F28|nr:hypothetical protein [Deinococcus sp. SL84]MCY1703916.1 hypothetical protein [Deinococcus sp. SL84]
MPTPPPVPDTPEALAIKRFLYNNFWPLSALVMKNPNPPKRRMTHRERVETGHSFLGNMLDVRNLEDRPQASGKKRGGWDTRSTEEKDFERHGVHGQHYWEPYLDPHGNAK